MSNILSTVPHKFPSVCFATFYFVIFPVPLKMSLTQFLWIMFTSTVINARLVTDHSYNCMRKHNNIESWRSKFLQAKSVAAGLFNISHFQGRPTPRVYITQETDVGNIQPSLSLSTRPWFHFLLFYFSFAHNQGIQRTFGMFVFLTTRTAGGFVFFITLEWWQCYKSLGLPDLFRNTNVCP